MKRSKKQFCVSFFAFWLCSVILFTSCNHHLGGDLSEIQVETDLGTIASTETATTDTMDPSVDIPAPEEQYLVMKDFSLQKVNYANFQTEDVVDFSFSELAARLNTVYASDPYVSNLESSIGNPDSRKMSLDSISWIKMVTRYRMKPVNMYWIPRSLPRMDSLAERATE